MAPPLVKSDHSSAPQGAEGSPAMQGSAASCHGHDGEGATGVAGGDAPAMPSSPAEADWGVFANRDREELEPCRVTLLTLPPELLLNIMAYLDAKVVIHRLGLVCKQLHQLVSNVATWKIRISKRWPRQYPIIPVNDDTFNWQLACMEREEQHKFWSGVADMDHFSLAMGHSGEIDSVHLMQEGELCISGSRDRSFHLWDLRKLDIRNAEESMEAAKIKSIEGHKGWVWHITSKDDIMCTSSWDQWIKLWDVNAECAYIQGFRGSSAFLCSTLHQYEVHAAAFDKHVYVFDRRDRNQASVAKIRLHRMAVLCLASDDDYIISASEDMTIAVFDRRAGKLLKRVQLDKYPMCMSYGLGQLWVGRKDGQVTVIDPTEGKFDVVQTYDVGHTNKMTAIQHSLGSVITCSIDRTIKIHEPNHEPSTMCTIDNAASISSIHASNGVLAAGGSDLCVNIWRPSQLAD